MTNTNPLLPLLSLIAAREDGSIGGPTVDAKIDELTARAKAEGMIVDVTATEITD